MFSSMIRLKIYLIKFINYYTSDYLRQQKLNAIEFDFSRLFCCSINFGTSALSLNWVWLVETAGGAWTLNINTVEKKLSLENTSNSYFHSVSAKTSETRKIEPSGTRSSGWVIVIHCSSIRFVIVGVGLLRRWAVLWFPASPPTQRNSFRLALFQFGKRPKRDMKNGVKFMCAGRCNTRWQLTYAVQQNLHTVRVALPDCSEQSRNSVLVECLSKCKIISRKCANFLFTGSGSDSHSHLRLLRSGSWRLQLVRNRPRSEEAFVH